MTPEGKKRYTKESKDGYISFQSPGSKNDYYIQYPKELSNYIDTDNMEISNKGYKKYKEVINDYYDISRKRKLNRHDEGNKILDKMDKKNKQYQTKRKEIEKYLNKFIEDRITEESIVKGKKWENENIGVLMERGLNALTFGQEYD